MLLLLLLQFLSITGPSVVTNSNLVVVDNSNLVVVVAGGGVVVSGDVVPVAAISVD